MILSEIESNSQHQLFGTISADGGFDVGQKDHHEGLRNENSSLFRKALRAELLVGGTEALGMGILVALPTSITKWEEGFLKKAKHNLKRAWTMPPVFDKDDWAIYYNALRSQGATRLQSFLFSTLQSTIWEYCIEAVAERPSIQDLFVTPIVGSIIGELAHGATMKMRKNGFTLGEKILVTVINPSFILNNGYKTPKTPKSIY